VTDSSCRRSERWDCYCSEGTGGVVGFAPYTWIATNRTAQLAAYRSCLPPVRWDDRSEWSISLWSLITLKSFLVDVQ
jgi:hypothetical protein